MPAVDSDRNLSTLSLLRRSTGSRIGLLRFRRAHLAVAGLFLFWPAFSVCQLQSSSVLCRGGNANFDAESRTGVKVHVGAARHGGTVSLATRACAATLSWEDQQMLVATDA